VTNRTGVRCVTKVLAHPAACSHINVVHTTAHKTLWVSLLREDV